MRTLCPHLLAVKVDSDSSPSQIVSVHSNNNVQASTQLAHNITSGNNMTVDINEHFHNNIKLPNSEVDSKLYPSILRNSFAASNVQNNHNVGNMTVDRSSQPLHNVGGSGNQVPDNNNVHNTTVDSSLSQTEMNHKDNINTVHKHNAVRIEVNTSCSHALIDTVHNNRPVLGSSKVQDIKVGINSKVNQNNILHNMTVVGNLHQNLLHNVHNINNVRTHHNVNINTNSDCSQSLITQVPTRDKVRVITRVPNIQEDSRFSQAPTIVTCNNINKVYNTCFNSFSTCSVNRSSNFYFTADRALSLPTIATNHGDCRRKKISHCNIIQDKTIINTINASTILTCSCCSLLQSTATFFDRTLPLTVHMYVITIPPKIWRPKPIDKFIPLPPYPDVDDDLYLYPAYGLAIRRTKDKPPPPSTRDDLILWDDDIHLSHLQTNLHLRDDMDVNVRHAILRVIEKNSDAFDEKGVSRPVLGYEFYIDTGASPPVCCQFPQYGVHESKVMTSQIEALTTNK